MISDSPSDTSARQRSQNAGAIGMPAIDEQMAAAPQMPAEHRKPRQRLLGDDPQLIRQRREDHRRVVDALVVRDEDVGRARRDPLEPFDRDANAGGLQNQPRPRARAAVREVAAAIEQARHDRRRAEHDGVDGDGGNEKEDRPPPVIRRNAQLVTNLQIREFVKFRFYVCCGMTGAAGAALLTRSTRSGAEAAPRSRRVRAHPASM